MSNVTKTKEIDTYLLLFWNVAFERCASMAFGNYISVCD